MGDEAARRLRAVPWGALAGLGAVLAPALGEVLAGAAAERVLDRLLRANKGFTADQRAVCAEAVFGVGLWRRALRARVDGGPVVLLAVLARELGGFADAEAVLGVTVPALRPESADWRDQVSVPDWIAAHFVDRFGADAEAAVDAMNVPGPVCLRANGSREELAQALAARGVETVKSRFARDGLRVVTPRPNLFGLGSEFVGRFEVQDEGSQLLGELVEVAPGEEVLDLCAGAGGKTLQLARRAAVVHATDVDAERLSRLRTRAEKSGAVVRIHGASPPEGLRVRHVLVDAPCSELGVLRRGPDVRWRLEEGSVKRLAAVQRELVEAGLRCLVPGGRLVYATCTVTRAENELVVEDVLAAHPEVRVVRAGVDSAAVDERGFLSVSPHRHGTDGFFGAVLEKRA